MASGQTFYPPAVPVLFSNIYNWAKEIVSYLRAVRPIAGGNMRITQTKSGSIFSAEDMSAPVGSVQPTFMDIYGAYPASAGDGRYTSFMKRIKDSGWLPCDGGTYAVADYPALAYALGTDMGDATFNVPDLRGRMLMGVDRRSVTPQYSDAYNLGNTGGYRRHGQTENNHHDHVFTIDLGHTHEVDSPSAPTAICAQSPTGDPPSCEVGSPIEVPLYTGTPPTVGPPVYDGSSDGFTPPTTGLVQRTGGNSEIVTIRAQHWGDDGDGSITTPGDGNVIDDVDNRPPYIVCNYIIKAR